jgi:PIN domain nuclease of toxin-antitoxin system
MTILLDTNAFIWWLADDVRLGRKARADIANPRNIIYISSLSFLECSIKVRLGRLKVDFNAVDQELSEGRLLELQFDTFAARQFVTQQNLPQADPFDVAIVAQAVAKHMTLMTSDDHILKVTVAGLRTIDAEK